MTSKCRRKVKRGFNRWLREDRSYMGKYPDYRNRLMIDRKNLTEKNCHRFFALFS